MDISAQHDSDDAAPEATEAETSLSAEQVARMEAATRAMGECGETLERISTEEFQYGVPDDLERLALLNAYARILCDAGLTTMEDLLVRKTEAMAEAVVQATANAREHARQVTIAKIAVPASEMPKRPPPPPRKRARR